MTTAAASLVRTTPDGAAIRLVLDRPARHNSLVPALLADLRRALAGAIAERPVAIVLTGSARSFSTGGDLAGFLAETGDPTRLAAYADSLVGALNDTILDLLACPAPVIAAINGPLTGGSLGLMLAADLVVMAEHAFIQPYYAEVGFAPDGGWTALLPERIGAGRAAALLMLNRRLNAAQARELGLTDVIAPARELDTIVTGWIEALAAKEPASLSATRRLVWDAERIATVRRRLEAERRAFVELVNRSEVETRMRTLMRGFEKQTA